LTLGGDVFVSNKNGDHIGTAPKLALVVVSATFREHLEAAPGSNELKVSYAAVNELAVRVLLEWTKSIVHSSNGKFGVGIPSSNRDLLRLRFVAHKLGMQQYVRHHEVAYKKALCERIPTMEECDILERRVVGVDDELISVVGGRFGYLCRKHEFNTDSLTALATFLETHDQIRKAVDDADERSAHARRH
jgi:hypothetical protein